MLELAAKMNNFVMSMVKLWEFITYYFGDSSSVSCSPVHFPTGSSFLSRSRPCTISDRSIDVPTANHSLVNCQEDCSKSAVAVLNK